MLEVCENGELFDVLAPANMNPLGGFNERITRYYFNQLLDSLEYLHSKGVTHWDLKPENLLLDSNWNIKIADFGFASTGLLCAT